MMFALVSLYVKLKVFISFLTKFQLWNDSSEDHDTNFKQNLSSYLGNYENLILIYNTLLTLNFTTITLFRKYYNLNTLIIIIPKYIISWNNIVYNIILMTKILTGCLDMKRIPPESVFQILSLYLLVRGTIWKKYQL